MEEFSNYVYIAMAVIGGIWILLWLFVALRRRASNLTPASAAKVQKKAAPDFLSVDHKKRAEAIARGEAYDQVLVEREAAEAAAAAGEPAVKELTLAEKFARIASILFSVFTLLVTMMRIFNDAEGLTGAGNKVVELVTQHPIAFAVALFVIGFHLFTFFANKKWKEAHKA
jgi:hypothetical protein